MNRLTLIALAFILAAAPVVGKQQEISRDRDLKEIDLTSWPCLNRLEGSAKTPDGLERNRFKNRSMPDIVPSSVRSVDVAGFLQMVAEFDNQNAGRHRQDLSPDDRKKLEALEKQLIAVTGYMTVAYCGPPETTNCASSDFHDWHLEITEKPGEHEPQPGDPTAIVCEITPRTQNAIYKSGVRIQDLAGFFRNVELMYEKTGHPAAKVRLTGYMMWDDEHNGTADIGKAVKTAPPGRFHNPWRQTAWELHPVIKIERADGITTTPTTTTTENASAPPPTGESVQPRTVEDAATATPATTTSTAPTPNAPPATQPQSVTITQPFKVKIPYGETTIPRGTKLPVTGRNGANITVKYMDATYNIPASYTDAP